MRQDLPTTSYALLGLLTFGEELTAYQLKQWAGASLRFFWVAPAMSHVYREVGRLEERGLIGGRDVLDGERTIRTYAITDSGRAALAGWLRDAPVEFPVLKHPVALRLFLGHVAGPTPTRHMLREYLEALDSRIAELSAVREGLGDDPAFASAARVADWGLRYYAFEAEMAADLVDAIEDGGDAESADEPPA